MKTFLFFFCFMFLPRLLPAVDMWRYPESADENSLFAGASSPSFSFTSGFQMPPVEFTVDYIIPGFLPFSFGLYFKAPDPNLKSFGTRLGYHINLDSRETDLYFFYVFDFGFLRNDTLTEYNDEEQELRWFDFRAGLRHRVNKFLCFSIESDYKFQGITMGLSLKIF